MRKHLTLLLLFAMILSACGTRGSLYLPPRQTGAAPAADSAQPSP